MSKFIGRSAVVALAVAAVVGAGNATAFADPVPVGHAEDGTPIWASEADADAEVVEGTPGTGEPTPEDPSQKEPRAEICDPGFYIYRLTNIANSFDVKFREEVENNTSSTLSYTVRADTTGTTTFGVSVNVAGEVGTKIFGKIKVDVNGSIQRSMTTTYGSSIAVQVRPRSTLKAHHGIWRENVRWNGHRVASNCRTSNELGGTAWAPYTKKWKIFY